MLCVVLRRNFVGWFLRYLNTFTVSEHKDYAHGVEEKAVVSPANSRPLLPGWLPGRWSARFCGPSKLQNMHLFDYAYSSVRMHSAALLFLSAFIYLVTSSVNAAEPLLMPGIGDSLSGSSNLMTLSQAESIALKNDSLSKKAEAQRDSLMEKSVAANTWPDPKLSLGMMNLSASSFKFNQEPMTQAVIGVTQMFPPWGAVGAKSDQMVSKSEAMGHAAKNQRLMTLSGVRKSWMMVYMQYHAKRLVKESLDVFEQFINVAKFQYRQGRGNQQDVIRAQLEQNLLEDKLSEASASYEVAVAALSRWLGKSVPQEGLDMEFPALPDLPSETQIEGKLENHPTVLQRKMNINSAENGVTFANSQSRPGWALNLQYGFRADAPSGMARDDLVSAMLSFELPLFTGKRQDRLIAASKSELVSSQEDLDDWRREIRMRFEKSVAMYTRADERVQLYKGSVLPHSRQNTEATLKAYKSGVTDFNVLVRARLTELKSQLQFYKLQVERANAQIDLLYFAGTVN